MQCCKRLRALGNVNKVFLDSVLCDMSSLLLFLNTQLIAQQRKHYLLTASSGKAQASLQFLLNSLLMRAGPQSIVESGEKDENAPGVKRRWYEEKQKRKAEELQRLGLDPSQAHR